MKKFLFSFSVLFFFAFILIGCVPTFPTTLPTTASPATTTTPVPVTTTTTPAPVTTTTTTLAPTFDVTFESNGGSAVAALTDLTSGSVISAPAVPTKDGYTFGGWYKESGLSTLWSFTADTVSADITLYAKWTINSYIISFEENGGSEVAALLLDYHSLITAPTAPTKEGYSFDGWHKEAALTNGWNFSSDLINGDTTLYAKWTANSYTMTFVVNGGSEILPITQAFASAVSAPTAPTKNGFTFDGWYADEGFVTAYVFGTMPSGNLNVYAKWTANQYTISFESNGGDAVTAITQVYGSEVNDPVSPSKTGVTFDGWYTEVGLINLYSFTTMPAENITLYAKWSVRINFIENGGPEMLPIVLAEGATVTAPETPDRLGYTFGGFFADEAFTTEYVFTTMPAQSINVYVKWVVNQYTVSFESNGGSAVTSLTQDFGSVLTAPANPTKAGITFDGWYTETGLTNLYTFTTMPAENITLYAKWTVKVIFVVNGGNPVEAIAQAPGTAITAPLDPTRNNGFLLDGFFADAALTVPYVFTTMPSESISVYLAWKKPISTTDDLLYLINNGGWEYFYLTNDIDMNGISLSGSTKTLTGILDGKGYTIRNAVIVCTANKTGFLFKNVNAGGVRDLKFVDCDLTGVGEANAFLSAYALAGTFFENLEFTNVSSITTGSYGALIFGDVLSTSPAGSISIKNITVTNDDDHKVQGSSYVGGLVGSSRAPLTFNFENIYFDSNVNGGSQCVASIMGRDNSTGITLNVTQAVVKGTIVSAKNVGVVLGTSVATTKVNVNHLFVSDFVGDSDSNKVDILVGNPVSGIVITSSEIYYNSETVILYQDAANTLLKTPTASTGYTSAQLDSAWFTASGMNATFFTMGAGTILRNYGEVEVVETGCSVITSGIELYYLVGETLDLTGLQVKANFSDGSSVDLDASAYTVDSSLFNNAAIGIYTITVTYKTYVKTFDITVVSVDHILVQDLNVKTTYLIGSSLNLSGLVVKAILSDGNYLRLTDTDYTVNSTAFNGSAVGTYDISITYKSFPAVTFKVHVVTDTYVMDLNTVKVLVSDDYAGVEGALSGNFNQFKTIKSALSFLAGLSLGSEITKVVFVEDGTYYEKLEIAIPNLMLIGESKDNTIITYDAASGLENPNGANWGTQGSATLAIKSAAANFFCKNITIANGFDYNNATIGDKQGVALVNEADKAIYYNVKFLGWQDTLYAKKGRQYYYQCYVEGVVDFIFGNAGPAFFEECVIHSLDRSTGCLTAQKGYNDSTSAVATYGYVFYNNTFTAGTLVPAGSVDLGRPWDQYAKVAYLNNTFGAHISTRGWTEMSGILPTNPNVGFKEYQNEDPSGTVLAKTTNGVELTLEQAALYSDKAIVFAQVNGGLDFGSAWTYSTSLTALQSMSYPS